MKKGRYQSRYRPSLFDLYGHYLVCLVSVNTVNAVLLVAALLKEFLRNLSEHCVAENVLVLLAPFCSLRLELIKLGSDKVCGTAVDRLFVADIKVIKRIPVIYIIIFLDLFIITSPTSTIKSIPHKLEKQIRIF